jgi:hypothetical protein
VAQLRSSAVSTVRPGTDANARRTRLRTTTVETPLAVWIV